MTETTEQAPKTYDGSISDMVKSLINAIVKDSQEPGAVGETPLEKIRNQLTTSNTANTLQGIAALSAYMQAKAEERQATALESLAKTASKLQVAESLDSGGQAIIDDRISKRDYLATTYSLPMPTLSLLWAMRGMLVDASIRALSKPDRFDPYRKLTTEEIAWTLRLAPGDFYLLLPRTSQGSIDFSLLEEFDILHYSGTEEEPDDWMYGG